VTAVAAGLVGGVLGPFVMASKERRQARAHVAERLETVERSRWALDGVTKAEFRTARTDFAAAALVARVPRTIVERYVELAKLARRLSDRSAEDESGSEHGGGIPSEIDWLVKDAARMVTAHVWAPTRALFLQRLRLRRLAARAASVRTELGPTVPTHWWPNPDPIGHRRSAPATDKTPSWQ
jgi:hypothetical protein